MVVEPPEQMILSTPASAVTLPILVTVTWLEAAQPFDAIVVKV